MEDAEDRSTAKSPSPSSLGLVDADHRGDPVGVSLVTDPDVHLVTGLRLAQADERADPVLLSTWAAITVAPAASSGALPNWYQPATSGLAGSAIWPSGSTPCGSTVMSMPSRATATRVGAAAAS